MKLILIGPPGAGKGTQASRISERYHVTVVSTGELFRRSISVGDKIGNEVSKLLSHGHLAPDQTVLEMVQERLLHEDCQRGYLLDGFPRTLYQVSQMKSYGIYPQCVVNLVVPDRLIIDRLSGRLVHSSSGRVYHQRYNPPHREGLDDITQEPLTVREDDSVETVMRRLRVYHKVTEPILEFYAESRSLVLHDIDAVGTLDEVSERIFSVLEPYSVAKEAG